jgi:hypothetical protein
MAGQADKGRSMEKDEQDERRRGLSAQQWVIALLIGAATVFAAAYSWRAAAIGSTAAFDDRQSISETLAAQQQRIDVSAAAGNDSRDYARYLVDYGVAAELDNQAAALEKEGRAAPAADARREAESLRRAATERAAEAGVFGSFSIADDLAKPSDVPRPFSLDDRIKARTVEEATGINSPGQLDPDSWAEDAEGIRDRINGLAVWTVVMLVAVLLFTIGEANSSQRRIFRTALTLGMVVLLFGAIGGLTTDFFA